MATKEVYEWEFDLEEYLMTVDVQEDYVARMKTRRPLVSEDLINEIIAERTDIRPDTLRMCAGLLDDKLIEKVCDGHIVTTATATYVPTIPGVFMGTSGIVDPAKNMAMINITPSMKMREALKSVKLKFSNYVRSMGGARIGLVRDVTTGKTDGTITPGGMVDVTGNKIRCVEGKEGGNWAVRFLKADTMEEAATVTLLGINDPKRLMFNVPTLEDGAYILQIETYFSNSAVLLRQSRIIDYPVTLYVGDRPNSGGDGDDDRPVIE